MAESRSLVVQSVLFGNDPVHIERAGVAMANSVHWARVSGLIDDWELSLGDCSPDPILGDDSLNTLKAAVEGVGGVFSYVPFGENLGSAAGHNALAGLSESELMLILNPDAQVDADTVSFLTRALSGQVGIVESRQIPIEHPKDFEVSSGLTSWASTACALTSRKAFDSVGGFDSVTFFLYCDDVDYSWRLRLGGYTVVFEPAARVFHDKRLTVTGEWLAGSAEIYYSAEAALLLADKYSRPDLVKKLLAAFAREGNEHVRRAVREYQTRANEGRLVRKIDSDHKVAEFVNGNYAVHRF